MPTRNIRDKLSSYSLRTFVQFAAQAFAADLNKLMDENGTDYCIIHEHQIRVYVSPSWLRKGGTRPQDISIVGIMRNKGVKFWGVSRGFYVFYRGQVPSLGDKWRKQVFGRVPGIRKRWLSQGETTGSEICQRFQEKTIIDQMKELELPARETGKDILFIGGIHGVGKTTLIKEMKETYGRRLTHIGESVNINEFVFKHRNDIRDTAEICWYARYIEMIVKEITPSYPFNIIVDRTIFDFIPYSDRLSAMFIEHNANKFLRFLRSRGHHIHQIFFTAPIEVVAERIRNRNRPNLNEEINTLPERMDAFDKLAKRLHAPVVECTSTEETIDIVKKILPAYFRRLG